MAPRRGQPSDDLEGAATKSDVAGMKRQARQNNAAYGASYNRGLADAQAGVHQPPTDRDDLEAYEFGHSDYQPAPEGGDQPTPAPTPPGAGAGSSSGRSWRPKPPKADSAAGFLLGLALYPLVINYMKGGLPAVKGWFAAKFLNRPYNAAPAAPTAAAAPQANTANPQQATA